MPPRLTAPSSWLDQVKADLGFQSVQPLLDDAEEQRQQIGASGSVPSFASMVPSLDALLGADPAPTPGQPAAQPSTAPAAGGWLSSIPSLDSIMESVGLGSKPAQAAPNAVSATFIDGRQAPQSALRPGESVGSMTVVDGRPGAVAQQIAAGGGKASRYAALIEQVSREEGVPADVLAALIDTEQSGEDSVSPAGARGIMQVVPGQGFDLPGENAADPLTSIRQGARAVKAKYRAVGSWEEAGRAYFGYGTDAGGMTTSRYGTIYDQHRARYQGAAPSVNAASPPAASAAPPPAPPAPAASLPSQPAAGGSDWITVRHRGTGTVSRFPRDQWDGVTNKADFEILPDDGRQAQMSDLDAARAGQDGMQAQALSMKAEQPGTDTPITNPDGSVTTERSITVTDERLNGGRPTNIPTVWGGRIVSDDDAIRNAAESGIAWPSFDTIEEAVAAAEQRSRDLGAGRATSVGGAVVPPEVRGNQPYRNRPVRGEPIDERQGSAQPAALMLRGPLSQQPEGAGEQPYDPRDADQGAHELPPPPLNVEGATSGPTPVPPGYTREPAPTSQTMQTGVRQPTVAQSDEPLTLDQSVPSPPGWSALVDAAGNVVQWVRDAASNAVTAVQDNMAGNRRAVEDANAAAGTDQSPLTSAVNTLGSLVQPAGGAVPLLDRMQEIRAQAAAELGRNPLDQRVTDDPGWRARHPDEAQEYDDLANQFGLAVMGQAGDTPRIQKPTPAIEQALRSDYGPRHEQLSPGILPETRLGPATDEYYRGAREYDEVTPPLPGDENLSGPVSVPVDTSSRLNAGFGVVPEGGSRRMYHGTGRPFDTVDASKFNRNSWFGPAYYLTDDAEAAGQYAGVTPAMRRAADAHSGYLERARQGETLGFRNADEAVRHFEQTQPERARTGSTVRAVDIPPDVRLFDVEAKSVPPDVVDSLRVAASDVLNVDQVTDLQSRLNSLSRGKQAPRGIDVYGAVYGAAGLSRERANAILRAAGFDGIRFSQTLEETLSGAKPKPFGAVAIFPESLNKIRNAFSGEVGGATLGALPPGQAADRLGAVNRVLGQGVASAVSGGTAAAAAGPDPSVDENGNPSDPYRQAKAFAAGAALPFLATRGARLAASRLGRAAEGDSGLLATFGHAPEPGRPNRAVAIGSDPSRRYEFRYRVADLGDLIASNLPNGAPNPRFPQELQPRARSRVASQRQIEQIARNLEPDALLTDVGRLDSGPMIVGADNIVESGNGRTLALQRAAKDFPERYQAYVDALRGNLGEYGLSERDLNSARMPVLVRERVSDVDRAAFAQEANNAGLLRMSSFEQAVQDAGNLADDAVTGLTVGENDTIATALRKTENRDLVRRWVGSLPENEQAGVLDASGNLSAQGYERLTNALLVRTYGEGAGERLARTFIESADPVVRNIQTALMQSLPDVARSEALIRSGQRAADLSIADDVATAAEMLARLRREGVKVSDYLGQAAMFERELTPLQESILEFLDKGQRRPSTIREALKDYAARVENTADPNQADMFGGQMAGPTREDLWRGATAGSGVDIPDAPLLRAAEENPPTERVPADGAGLAGAPAPTPQSAPIRASEPPQQPVRPARPGPLPEGYFPTGGPEGTLSIEGAPRRLRSANLPPVREGAFPAGGSEGSLAIEGAPRPNPLIEAASARPMGTAEDVRIPEGFNAPQVRRVISAAERRAQNMQRRGLTAPSAWDWLKQAGFSGIYGPATLTNAVLGGAQELVLGNIKEGVRAVVSGRPGNYGAQLRAQARAAPEGLTGILRVLWPEDAAAAAARSGGSQGTAGLSERVVNPAGHFAARVLEKPGEVLTEAPDAVFRPIFEAQGMQREAGRVAAEQGMRGHQAAAYADQLMQDAAAVQGGQLPTMPETQRVLDAGKEHADQLGYKGDAGGFAKKLGEWSKRDDLIGVLASFLVPFPSMAGRMTTAAARSTPGIGLLPSVRRGQPTKFDVVYDQAFGTAVAAVLAYWAFNGGITGSGPADPEKRKMMIDQGWQPNAYIVAGHYIPNRTAGRFQPMLDTAGEIHDAIVYGKPDAKPGEMAADLVKRGTRVATDQIGLSGLADFNDMLTQGFASQFPGWAARSGLRYLPYGGILRAGANALDDKQRRPERWGDVGLSEAVRQNVKTAIPGLRQDVPSAQDTLGRDAPNPQQGFGAIIPRVTTERNDPVIRLFQDAGVDIGRPSDAITVGRVSGVELKPSEQRRWNQIRGQFVQDYADAYTGNPDFMALPPNQKEKYLKTFLQKAADYADKMIQSEVDADDLTNRATERAVKKAG